MNVRIRCPLVALLVVLGASCVSDEQAVADCHISCETLDNSGCVESDAVAECNEKCDLQPIPSVKDFNDCVDDARGSCTMKTCLPLIEVQAGSAPPSESEIDRCRRACNDTKDCANATLTSDCLSACDEGTAGDVTGFADCVSDTKSCEDNLQCYDTLGI